MTNTMYIHQPEKAISFTRLPNFLFEAPTFTPLSNEGKLLYAFILRRAELSRKNEWADEYGRIYLYYPICEVVDLLHCGRQKAVNTLRELQYSDIPELTSEILRIFIKRVEVGERAEKYSHTVPQEVRIYYRDIGLVDELPQSMAEAVVEEKSDEVA